MAKVCTRKSSKGWKQFILLVILAATSQMALATTIHVPSDYSSIQTAIMFAIDGDTVLVADGTYTEWDIDFLGKAIVVISENGRDVTIIDCQGNGRGFIFTNSETSTSVLSGFTIKNGSTNADGGGIYCSGASPTITDCIITNNAIVSWNDDGGGIYISGGSPTIINCIITGNSAYNGGNGGGIYTSGSPTITNCSLTGNSTGANGDGGGIYVSGGSPTITNCNITGNSGGTSSGSAGDAGGIYISGGYAAVTDCIINDNSANRNGGGVYISGGSAAISNCTIGEIDKPNIARSGAGIYISGGSPSITGCFIKENTINYSGGDGGGINSSNSSATIQNCVIVKNRVSGGSDAHGGGVYCSGSNVPTFINNTIAYNTASGNGGGIYHSGSSTLEVRNTIVWEDTAGIATFNSIYSTNYDVTYSDVEGDWPGDGNLNSDPLFADITNGDYHILESSPCIDVSDPDLDNDGTIWENDIDDRDPDGSRMDIGAFYFDQSSTIPPAPPTDLTTTAGDEQVTLSWTPNTEPDLHKYNIYRNTSSPAVTLIDSVVASSPPDTFYVDTGLANGQVYYYRITAVDNAGNESGYSDEVSATPFSHGPVWYISTSGSDETGDGSEGNPFATIKKGIDVASDGDTVLLIDGIFEENLILNSRDIILGSMFLFDADTSHIRKAVIDGHRNGSVMRVFSNGSNGEVTIVGFTLKNGMSDYGGAVHLQEDSKVSIDNVVITSNRSKYGSAIYCEKNSFVTIKKTLIINNSINTNFNSGAIISSNSDVYINNVTISQNSTETGASGSGYAILSYPGSDLTVLNSIIWDNYDAIYSQGQISLDYSIIQGDVSYGEGNLDADPLFVNSQDGNYHLLWGSPAIDAGDPTSPLDPDSTISDMGAYFFDQRQIPSPPRNLEATAGNAQVTLYWRKNSESDFSRYVIYGNTISNPTARIDSTQSITDTTLAITGLTIGTTYYFRVTAIDTQGYESWYSNEVSATPIDLTHPTVTVVSPTIGTTLEIGSNSPITWVAEDNVEVTSIDLSFSIDNGATWSNIVTGEVNDGEYLWLVPNSPSEKVGIQLIAYDAVGLSDTSEVMGLSIVIVYPTVVEISPPKELLSWRDKQITIAFSQQIDPNSITSDNIVFESGYSSQPDLSYSESTKTLSITTPTSFASLDTIMITLLASGITNIYGYQLDGDGDGTGGDDLIIEYTTAMLADYDTSGTIDVIDLAQFVQGWEEKDYFYELGPVIGTAPHFVSSLDSTFNIEDMMAFVMIWNWYVTNGGYRFHQWASAGNDIDVSTTSDSILIQLPLGAVAYELQIGYQPETVGIASPEIQGIILLTHTDEERGLFSLLSADVKSGHISLPIHITGKQSDITLSFRAVGYDGVVLSQFTKDFQLTSVPTEYALHQNYPNPFNPITVIEYDLPEDGHVFLVIYDILGREVKRLQNGIQSAGFHKVKWYGTNEMGEKVGTGVYLYRIQIGKFSRVRKMILLR